MNKIISTHSETTLTTGQEAATIKANAILGDIPTATEGRRDTVELTYYNKNDRDLRLTVDHDGTLLTIEEWAEAADETGAVDPSDEIGDWASTDADGLGPLLRQTLNSTDLKVEITKDNEGDGDFWIADTGEDARAVWTREDALMEAAHFIRRAQAPAAGIS